MNVSKRCDLYVLHVAIVVGPKQTHSSLVYIEIDWNVENVVFVRHTSSLSLSHSLSLSSHTGKRRYNIKIWKTFTDCFNCLPIAAIVDDKIFCCHGGECAKTLYTIAQEFAVSALIVMH